MQRTIRIEIWIHKGLKPIMTWLLHAMCVWFTLSLHLYFHCWEQRSHIQSICNYFVWESMEFFANEVRINRAERILKNILAYLHNEQYELHDWNRLIAPKPFLNQSRILVGQILSLAAPFTYVWGYHKSNNYQTLKTERNWVWYLFGHSLKYNCMLQYFVIILFTEVKMDIQKNWR